MPRWLRQFTFNKINEFYTKEAEAAEAFQNNKSGRTTLIDPSGKVNKEGWRDVQPMKSSATSKAKYK